MTGRMERITIAAARDVAAWELTVAEAEWRGMSAGLRRQCERLNPGRYETEPHRLILNPRVNRLIDALRALDDENEGASAGVAA